MSLLTKVKNGRVKSSVFVLHLNIKTEINSMLGYGETLESLRNQFPNHTDRQRLFIKKAVQAVESGEAAIIWDYPVI